MSQDIYKIPHVQWLVPETYQAQVFFTFTTSRLMIQLELFLFLKQTTRISSSELILEAVHSISSFKINKHYEQLPKGYILFKRRWARISFGIEPPPFRWRLPSSVKAAGLPPALFHSSSPHLHHLDQPSLLPPSPTFVTGQPQVVFDRACCFSRSVFSYFSPSHLFFFIFFF